MAAKINFFQNRPVNQFRHFELLNRTHNHIPNKK